jgi:hypothetical protein
MTELELELGEGEMCGGGEKEKGDDDRYGEIDLSFFSTNFFLFFVFLFSFSSSIHFIQHNVT